jgi:hypothetical protein
MVKFRSTALIGWDESGRGVIMIHTDADDRVLKSFTQHSPVSRIEPGAVTSWMVK